MKKEDKRSRKTVKAIQDALLSMLAEYSLSDIKIIELCRRADINRTTFYLHYENVDEVQRSIREGMVERIFEKYKSESFLYTLEHPLDFLVVCIEVITSYEGFENFVRRSAEAPYFLEELKKAFVSRAYAEYTNQSLNKNDYAFYILHFMTAGTFDTFIVWLRSDKSVPLSSILDRCAKMLSSGYEALLNTSDA